MTGHGPVGGVETPGTALELRSVRAGYGPVTVLREVDLVVRPGEVVALLGPNGAGKTTLLRTAAGLLRPSAGVVEILGVDATRMPPHQRARAGLCLIPEGRGIFRSLTVAENLQISTPKWVTNPDRELVFGAFPQLKARIDQVAGTMSGGEQQMLALARAMLAEPRIVLVDEVSVGLAPIVVDVIFEALSELRERGLSILLVEQYVNRALAMADRVYMITKGVVTDVGSPSSLSQEALMAEYMGADAENLSA